MLTKIFINISKPEKSCIRTYTVTNINTQNPGVSYIPIPTNSLLSLKSSNGNIKR